MVYTATLGYALITCGIYTYEWVKHSSEEFSEFSVYPEYVGLMFVGSFIAFLFWVSSLGKRLMWQTPCMDNIPTLLSLICRMGIELMVVYQPYDIIFNCCRV